MTKDTCDIENNFINEMEVAALDVITTMEKNVEEGMSIEKNQMDLAKKLKDVCLYFKDCIKPSELDIKVLPNKKQKNDTLSANVLLYYFLSVDKRIASMYMEELEVSKKFSDAEIKKLRDLEKGYVENEEIISGISRYDFAAVENFMRENTEYFSVDTRLRFGISALKFLKLTSSGKKIEAIRFLSREMKCFLPNLECRREIRKMLMYLLNDISLSSLEEYIEKIIKVAHEDYCFIRDIPANPFLGLIFTAGTKSVPVLLEASKVFKDIDMEKFVDYELVVKLPKGIAKAFHSLFVCPVLKCVCDADNLPVLLECGHVISQNAITQISNSGTKQVFKCPYCPTECNFYKSRVLFLRN